MKRILFLAAAFAASVAAPAAAQNGAGAANDAKVLAMLQEIYKPEPLTAEQQARLPAATQAVTLVLPDGFYARMMRSTMDRMFEPLLKEITTPSTDELTARLGITSKPKIDLDEAERKRVVAILDPVAEQRSRVLLEAISQSMSDMMNRLEGPIREGLAKSYAVRFSSQQLADINAFFATPTGKLYASQSMEAFTDPQTMGKMMESLPQITQQLPQMLGGLDAKMADLPKPREYADLNPAQRQEVASAFGITVEQLRTGMARSKKQ